MEIESIRQETLRSFAETGGTKGLPGNLVDRLRNMLSYLAAVESMSELHVPPNFGAHELTGNLAGVWSLR